MAMPESAWAVLRTSVAEGAKPPTARGGHTATLVEKNLLILGGQQHKSAGVFEYFSLNPVVLDTETHTWFQPRVALGKVAETRCASRCRAPPVSYTHLTLPTILLV